MKEKESELKKIPRRCFLSNCAKLTLGATLLGSGIKAFGDTNDSYEEYSYCIYRCPSPCNYDTSCKGCRNDDTGARATCTVRNCAIEKEMPSCAHCADLSTCNKSLWVNYPGQRQYALNKQEQWGLLSAGVGASKYKEGFKLYPSSAINGITLQNSNQVKAEYNIMDISGQIRKKGKIQSSEQYVDVSNLNPGNYILNIIKNKDLLYVGKFIKQ